MSSNENTYNLTAQKKATLGYRIRDLKYKKEYAALKIKIALNCFELLTLYLVLFIVFFMLTNITSWSNITTPIAISGIISFVFVFLFYKHKNYQLTINRFDKENIYKKISQELLNDKR